MRNLTDVACRLDNQLYLAEEHYRIHQVSADDYKYDRWLTPESTPDTFDIYTMSLTSRRLLVVLEPRSLRQYSTTDKRLLRTVQLPQYVIELYHAIETPRGTFVVCHQGSAGDEKQYAVSRSQFHACNSPVFDHPRSGVAVASLGGRTAPGETFQGVTPDRKNFCGQIYKE